MMFQNKNTKLIRSNNNNPNNNNINNNKKVNTNLYTKEFEINDVKISVRNILTKGHLHDEISQFSGASISTRGRYISPPEKSRGAAILDRPLYLFIQGNSKQDVDLAVQKIEEVILRESNPNMNQSKFSKFQPNRNSLMSPPVDPSNNLFSEKIMVGLDHAPDAFDLKGHVIGAAGANLNYIRNETGAMATLRGKGTGFIELNGYESNEPMHLFLEHTNFSGLLGAKQLAKNLIETIQQELVQFQQMNPPIATNVQIAAVQPGLTHAELFQTQGHPPPQQQISITQNHLAVPPPTIIHPNGIIQQPPPQTILQPQSFIQQNQLLPIQIHHQAGTNMVIQQTAAPGQDHQANPIGNLSIPPPSIPMAMKTGQLVQIHGVATPHLSHPPPNIQIQQQQQPTQILLNQAPPNYQLQYVQQTAPLQNATGDPQSQPQQVTIQHIYQTPQQIHGIVQQAAGQTATIQPHFEHIQVRPGQQIQATQQFITLPGSTTAYMMPPPNIIQSHQSRQQIQNFIYSAQQPTQIQYSMASTEITAAAGGGFVTTGVAGIGQQQQTISTTNATNEVMVKTEEQQGEGMEAGDGNKSERILKFEDEFSPNKKPPSKLNSPHLAHPVSGPQNQTTINLPFTQMPPPQIQQQQIIDQQNHTILHHVPVSIHPTHQIQISPHVSANSNFIINGQQWQATTQQQPPNTNQIIHVTQQQQPQLVQQQFRHAPDQGSQSLIAALENFRQRQQQQQQQQQQGQMQIEFHHNTAPPPPPPPNIMNNEQQLGPPPQRFAGGNAGDIHHDLQFKGTRKRKADSEVDTGGGVPRIGTGLNINERDSQRMVVVADHPPPSNCKPSVGASARGTPSNISDENCETSRSGYVSNASKPPIAPPPPIISSLMSSGGGGGGNQGPLKHLQHGGGGHHHKNDDSPFYFDNRSSNQFMNGPPHRHHHHHHHSPYSQFDDNRRFSMDSYGPPPPPHGYPHNRNGGGGDGRFRGQW